MAEQVTIDPTDDIAEIVERDPKPFILDAEAGGAFVKRVRQHVAEQKPDLTTDTGRKAIASLAYKVGKAKTRIDAERKDMGAELRAKLKTINDAGKTVVEALAEIQAEARKPLTEWEAAEKARQERADSTLRELQALIQSPAPMGASVETVEERLAEVKQVEIDAATFGDDAGFAEKLKDEAIAAVSGALEGLKKAEAERAELEALRRDKEEREAREQAEAEKRAQAERDEQARQERVDAAIKHLRECGEGRIGGEPAAVGLLEYEVTKKVVIDDSFGDRRAEAEAVRNEAIAKIEKMAAEAKAKREADEAKERERAAEAAREEERQRIAKEQADAAAEAERKARDKRHRARILTEVAEAFEAQFGLDGGQSQLIADAIAGGRIPHTSIQF